MHKASYSSLQWDGNTNPSKRAVLRSGTPASRTAIQIARGTYAQLNASVADLEDAEICYATDQDKITSKKAVRLYQLSGYTYRQCSYWNGADLCSTTRTITTLTPGTTVTPDFAASNNLR